MPKNRSKADAQRFHFKTRALQRFGLRISDGALQQIIRQIQSGRAEFIERQSNRITMFRVGLRDGSSARVVYDSKRKTLVTIMEDTAAPTSPSGTPSTAPASSPPPGAGPLP